ncbi:hypothetical protein ACFSCX_19065 [Bacillus salitolerans]|uniref:Uncharacterized protein n=1 Tax=Bacillus salitolerans TaxID=1437434 RepID=A0ABW4LVU4_9BACI
MANVYMEIQQLINQGFSKTKVAEKLGYQGQQFIVILRGLLRR